MQRYYEVVTSRTQLLTGLAIHLAAAVAIFLYVDPALLKWSAAAGVALCCATSCRRLIRHGNIRLRVDTARRTVELQQFGQPYFYRKYKVYQTRWFAILELTDQPVSRTLILNSDCFRSMQSYRGLRFDLRRLERGDAA